MKVEGRQVFCFRGTQQLSVLPGRESRLVTRGGNEFDWITSPIVLGQQSTGVQLRVGRIVGRGQGKEARAVEQQLSIAQREARKLRPWRSGTRVCLGVADGAVGGDVDLLATRDLDVLERV